MIKKREIDPIYFDTHSFAEDFREADRNGDLIVTLPGESVADALRRHEGNDPRRKERKTPALAVATLLAAALVAFYCAKPDPIAVTPGEPLVYGGLTYRTVVIGGKTWMAENLNHQTEGSWCYGGDPRYCDKYGRLYTWEAAMSACPAGWHLPSDAEWAELVDFVGNPAGNRLKSKNGWHNRGITADYNGSDEYRFSALPGGYRTFTGGFLNAEGYGYWWSATEDGSSFARMRGMDSNYGYVDSFGWSKFDALSVRCLMS